MSTIQKDTVVSFNYILHDGEGNLVDQTRGEPLLYLHGHGNIIPGLEKHLDNLSVGDKKKVEVPAAEAYGAYDEEKHFDIPRSGLPDAQLEPGMVLELTPDEGETLYARILKVTKKVVEVDANHPMAGQDLFFEVEIVGIRPATDEELQHKHVHGPGCHHNH